MEAAKSENVIEEVDLMNLVPRKPDWDLKRDVAKKLEKLEKRTHRAIAELIRERLKSGNQVLAQVVNAGTMGSQQPGNMNEDDDDRSESTHICGMNCSDGYICSVKEHFRAGHCVV